METSELIGTYKIKGRKLEIKILKSASNKIDAFKEQFKDTIKYFNIYDNQDFNFYQIYLNTNLNLNHLIALRELNLKLKAVIV